METTISTAKRRMVRSRTLTLEVAILDALHHGAQTVPEILALVLSVRRTTTRSLRQALSAMTRSGEIRRTARGRYAPQG